MIDIDHFFVSIFGGFAAQARMLISLYGIIAASYWLVSIPKNESKVIQENKNQNKIRFFFVGLAVLVTVSVFINYFFRG